MLKPLKRFKKRRKRTIAKVEKIIEPKKVLSRLSGLICLISQVKKIVIDPEKPKKT